MDAGRNKEVKLIESGKMPWYLAVVSLSAVTVFAGVKLITLGTGKLDTKHGSRQYQRSVKLNEIQKNNAKAGISRTDQGITLRIDNVGLDEGNLFVLYSVIK